MNKFFFFLLLSVISLTEVSAQKNQKTDTWVTFGHAGEYYKVFADARIEFFDSKGCKTHETRQSRKLVRDVFKKLEAYSFMSLVSPENADREGVNFIEYHKNGKSHKIYYLREELQWDDEDVKGKLFQLNERLYTLI